MKEGKEREQNLIDKLSFYVSLIDSHSISPTLITERGGGEKGERGKGKRTKPHRQTRLVQAPDG